MFCTQFVIQLTSHLGLFLFFQVYWGKERPSNCCVQHSVQGWRRCYHRESVHAGSLFLSHFSGIVLRFNLDHFYIASPYSRFCMLKMSKHMPSRCFAIQLFCVMVSHWNNKVKLLYVNQSCHFCIYRTKCCHSDLKTDLRAVLYAFLNILSHCIAL